MVERLPSSIYWNGLALLGIRRTQGPLSAYYRWLDDPRRTARVAVDDDNVPIEGVVRTWWDRVPASPEGFPEGASFALTPEESSYLASRAVNATPYSTMLGFLFDAGRADAEPTFPWEHPQLSAMSDLVRDDLDVAKHFSLLHHGAALLFNLLIALARDDETRADEYRAKLGKWQAEATGPLESFDLHRVWQLAPRAPMRVKQFVEDWARIVKKADGRAIAGQKPAHELVASREIRVKGTQRSRIAQPFRVAWNGASGSARLDYRWRDSVQRIALDVAEGRASA
jgi:hypothetical protein